MVYSSNEKIHIDIFCPVLGKMLVLENDAHSKWSEVFIITSTATKNTILVFLRCFVPYSFPMSLVSENAIKLTFIKIKTFSKNQGVKHKFGAPYRTATN